MTICHVTAALGFLLIAYGSVAHGSVLDGLPPLTCEQIAAIDAAIANGTVAEIDQALDIEGTIFVGDPRFPPIVTPTAEQQRVLDECYTAPDVPFPNPPPEVPQVGPGTGRRRRAAPGLNLDVACGGGVSSVAFVRTGNGNSAQVMVLNIGSAGPCYPTSNGGISQCSGDCCKVKFRISAVVAVLQPDTNSYTFPEIEIEHCTCVVP